MQASRVELETIEHLSPVAARMMLAAFPPHVREVEESKASSATPHTRVR